MSKVKSTKPQLYELLYIIPNNFTEEEAQKIHDKIKETITQKGGEISFEESWGKKKFAYPIDHFNHGYYNLVEFTSKRENVNDINYFLRFSDEVLRHQVVAIKYSNTEKKKAAEKIAEKEEEERVQKEKEEAQKQEEQEAELKRERAAKEESSQREEVKEDKQEKEKEEKKEEKKEEGKKEEKKEDSDKKDKKKVDLNDLDEKLDDLLNTDDLV